MAFFHENGAAAALMDRELLFNGGKQKSRILPPISRQPLGLVCEFLTELNPPILASMSPVRLSEVLWDVIYGIVRYKSAHVRVEERSAEELDVRLTIDEVLIVIRHMFALA